ncbi:MAG TPA: hypothetical protein VMF09_08790 [Solirubrobacteraceae bacterium]|nr:hypothetical protein [Solirubrobacteraceae bacterium]
MPTEQPTPQPATEESAVHTQAPPAYERRAAAAYEEPAYEPLDESDAWLEQDLPRRPRRRLLTPVPLALLGVLLCACGFIGGVLVEKGQGSSGSSTGGAASSLASRFASLRGGSAASRAGGAGASGTDASGLFGASGARPTAGTVAYLEGSTLYVTNSEGNTVKVTTSPATSVNKTVKSSVSAVHPGETVTITGSSGANGAVSAESISVGSAGGGLAALFGRGGSSAAGSSSSSKEPSLFGGG